MRGSSKKEADNTSQLIQGQKYDSWTNYVYAGALILFIDI